jgi:hypothetical protein
MWYYCRRLEMENPPLTQEETDEINIVLDEMYDMLVALS